MASASCSVISLNFPFSLYSTILSLAFALLVLKCCGTAKVLCLCSGLGRKEKGYEVRLNQCLLGNILWSPQQVLGFISCWSELGHMAPLPARESMVGERGYKSFSNQYTGFPSGAGGEVPTCQCRRCGFDPRVGKMPWRRAWQPTTISCLENPMNKEVRQATVHRVTKSWTRLKWLSTHTRTTNPQYLQPYK